MPKRVVEMKKGLNRLSVLDFIISVLIRHEKELDKSLAKIERITRKLERNRESQTTGEVSQLISSTQE